MTELAFLQEQLEFVGAELARLERSLATTPSSAALRSMWTSLRERQVALEEQHLIEAGAIGMDVCSYRVFERGHLRPRVGELGRVLDGFQSSLTSVYSAVRAGEPRVGGRFPAEVLEATAMRFAYSFAGSVGLVMTIPNERPLFGESHLDEAFRILFDVSQAESPAVVASYAGKIGPAAIRTIYRWTKDHAVAGLGADIEWRRALEVRQSIQLQAPEWDRLRTTIEATSEDFDEKLHVAAFLVGIDTDRNTFRARLGEGDHIAGAVAPSVDFAQPVQVPAEYRMALTKTTRRRYSVDEDDIDWTLDGLEPVE